MRANIMSNKSGIIGVSDHGGWAVLVTAAPDGRLLDRRRVELAGEGLPKLPHHSEGQRLPLDEAVELVERVRVSAGRHAVLTLDAVAMAALHILGVALRKCPQLPPTIAERIRDYRAQNVAELGDVPQGPGLPGRGAGLARALVRREDRMGRRTTGVACREPRRSLPPGAEGRRAAMGQRPQARDGGGHRCRIADSGIAEEKARLFAQVAEAEGGDYDPASDFPPKAGRLGELF